VALACPTARAAQVIMMMTISGDCVDGESGGVVLLVLMEGVAICCLLI
jgi:hypothetical protein